MWSGTLDSSSVIISYPIMPLASPMINILISALKHTYLYLTCSFHKDVAKSIAASSGSGGDDNYKSIRASLTQRTDMALNKLREISTRGGKGGKVTIEALQAAGLNESAQQWFLKLASSEGF